MYPAGFKLYRPASLEEALKLLDGFGEEAKILAGGQSLIPLMRLRLVKPSYIIYLGGIDELRTIAVDDGMVSLGALTTHREIAESRVVAEEAPLLREAASVIGDVQIRSMGTIGGSVAHADPAMDYGAVLAAMDGEVVVASVKGVRIVRFEDFILGPFTTRLEPSEMIVKIRIPRHGNWLTAYEKFAVRPGDLAVAGIAVAIRLEDGIIAEARIGVTGAGEKPFRAYNAEEALVGAEPGDAEAYKRAADEVYKECRDAPSDERASSWYRREIAKSLTVKALRRALDGA